ncbi:helix-turn-helix domain-containing protein [Leucobacter iarius]
MANRDDERDPNERITPAEAARISGLTPGGLAKMADSGRLNATRPGGNHRRYLRGEIQALNAPAIRSGER